MTDNGAEDMEIYQGSLLSLGPVCIAFFDAVGVFFWPIMARLAKTPSKVTLKG